MPTSKRSLKIFLCHAHNDRRTVHDLYARMVKDGFNVWMDVESLQPGQDWQREIRTAILKSDVVVVCLSQKFNEQKGFRHEELKMALAKAQSLPDDEIFIIPVRLEECHMPLSLHHLHRVDLFEAGGYKKLIGALRRYVDLK